MTENFQKMVLHFKLTLYEYHILFCRILCLIFPWNLSKTVKNSFTEAKFSDFALVKKLNSVISSSFYAQPFILQVASNGVVGLPGKVDYTLPYSGQPTTHYDM